MAERACRLDDFVMDDMPQIMPGEGTADGHEESGVEQIAGFRNQGGCQYRDQPPRILRAIPSLPKQALAFKTPTRILAVLAAFVIQIAPAPRRQHWRCPATAHLDLDSEQRANLAANLCTALGRAVPGSRTDLRGSLSTGTADRYSDIDILWEVPRGGLTTAGAVAPEAVGKVGDVYSWRVDPDSAQSRRRRLVFVRLSGVPLFWRIDLEICEGPGVDEGRPEADDPERADVEAWSRPASAIENAIAAVKATARGNREAAEGLLRRGFQRIGHAPPSWADPVDSAILLASACSAIEPSLGVLADELVELSEALRRSGLQRPASHEP